MHALVAAFLNSCRGLRHALATERAVQQEAALLALGVPAAFAVAPGPWIWLALVGVLVLMIAVELLNTAIEKLCDHVTPEHHPAIGVVKDLGSAAAFLAQAFALLVWIVAVVERLRG